MAGGDLGQEDAVEIHISDANIEEALDQVLEILGEDTEE